MTASTGTVAGVSRLRDPRVWLGVAVALVAVWFALRGVDPRAVVEHFQRARWGLLIGLSVPSYLAVVWLRALRWRHLTDAIQPISRAALFRATAVGFMANNLFPLRIGELVRVAYLAREARAPAAAVLATVVIERVIDGICVLAMAFVAVAWSGLDSPKLRAIMVSLAVVAFVTLVMLGWLRAAPASAIAFARLCLRPAPAHVSRWVLEQLGGFSAGLGALRGGAHVAWIVVDSAAIWFVASTLPILAGIWSVGFDLGGPSRTLTAAWMTLAALAGAVSLPSVPGFFGIYQAACKASLEQFGASESTAFAIGLLCNTVFWFTLTGLGALVLRTRRAHLRDLPTSVPE